MVEIIPLAGSLFLAGAILWFIRTIVNTLASKDLAQDLEWRYDVNRINELRRTDSIYRYFYPVVELLARFNRGAFPKTLPDINREILAAGYSRFWTADEYLAKQQVVALLLLPLYSFLFVRVMDWPGLILACVMCVLTMFYLRRNLTFQAYYRLMQIKRRLPFLLDLLTLLMEVGATFLQALKQAVDEYKHHPVGYEFGRVLAEMSMGKSRSASLEALRERLSDDEVTSIVGSIIQGENLGTPLARIFRTQADVLRIKRIQRAETMAGEAGVKMLLPAIVIMASTVIVILGPFILKFIYEPIV